MPATEKAVKTISVIPEHLATKGTGCAYQASALNIVLDPRVAEVAFQSHGKDRCSEPGRENCEGRCPERFWAKALQSFKKKQDARPTAEEDDEVEDVDGVLRLKLGLSIQRLRGRLNVAYLLNMNKMLRGDQVYGFTVPLNHTGPDQAKFDNAEELGRPD